MGHVVAIILGFVEGATEFIPVSSTGHLIVVRELLHVNSATGLTFDAILQLAASCALLVYFWKDIWHLMVVFFHVIFGKSVNPKDKTLLLSIILGTIPAVILGLFFERTMDTIFRNIHLVALALLAGSILMWYAEKKATHNRALDIGKGIVIGLFQCLALVPGISRSGATISGGLLAGLDQNEAVRFSFLLSIPILFGAGFKKLFEIRHQLFLSSYGSSLLLGSVAAFIVALFSIHFLIKYLKNHNLDVFIWYRMALFVAIFLLF